MRRPSAFVVCSLLLVVGTMLGQNPEYRQDPTWRAPEDAARKVNPLANRPAATAGGKKLFLRNCAKCHGDGSGIEKKHSADFQLPVVQEQPDGIIFWKITNGNTGRGMPSFSKLPELERWQLVLYLRTLKPVSSPL